MERRSDMDIYRNGKFEIGLNLDRISVDGIRELFRVMRECPECGSHPDAIEELEDEVWEQFLLRGIE